MNSLLSKFSDSLIQKLRGWDYGSELSELKKGQWLSEDEIKRTRFVLLKNLLSHCYLHVPFYRDVWRVNNFSPADIKKEQDLEILPIISKETLRSNYDSMISEKSRNYEIWRSSGSTGEPFPFPLDSNTIKYNTFASLGRGKSWWGFDSGKSECMIWSGVSDVSGTIIGRLQVLKRRLSWSLKNIKLLDVYSLDEESIVRGFKLFKQHKPLFIRAISSGLYRFCVGLQELGLNGRELCVKGAIYTGEGLSKAQRSFIEEILGCPTICEYGCTELGLIGFECPERNIHLSHDNHLYEFVKNGQPVTHGETAELVVTNLRNYTTPLIRYSVGDFVVASSQPCACGRTLPVIEEIQGRMHDTIVTPDGTPVHGLFFTHLFDKYDEIHQFRVIQEKINRLRIEFVSQDNVDNGIIDNLKEIVSLKFGPTMVIVIKQVLSLPISASGKTPWIISKIQE